MPLGFLMRPLLNGGTLGRPMRCGTLLAGSLALILASACGPSVPQQHSSQFSATASPVCPRLASQDPSSARPLPAPSTDAGVDPVTGDQSTISHAGASTADPAVTFVSAGGYWESGSAHGRYRVVVKTRCGEHCSEEVLLEQIDESGPTGSIRQVVPVPETAPMRVESVNFWPSGRWTGEIEIRLTDDDGKHPSRLCLNVTDQKNAARHGPCAP
jgi:hypothetical protein